MTFLVSKAHPSFILICCAVFSPLPATLPQRSRLRNDAASAPPPLGLKGMYDLASIYAPQLRSLDSVLEASNLNNYETLTKPLSKQLTQEMVRTFDSRKEQIRASLEEAILSRCAFYVTIVTYNHAVTRRR